MKFARMRYELLLLTDESEPVARHREENFTYMSLQRISGL